MQQSSPKRILEKRGSMMKQPNDSPTISPAQLLKRNTLDNIESTSLEIKMIPADGSDMRKGNLVAESLNDDITYVGIVPKKIEQNNVTQQEKGNQMKKVLEISDSQSPSKSTSISQIQSPYPSVIQDFTFSQSPAFLSSPFQFAGIVQCTFLINKSGFNTFRPKFYLLKNDECYLSAKKIGEKYIICTDKENIDRKHPSFVGQVSCKKNSKYFFYDTGLNPKRKKEPYRKCLGELYFVNCPKQNEPRQQYVTFPDSNKQFCNRAPKWDQQLQTHTLNFFNRVKISSIKNFQLILQDEHPERIYLQMGKWAKHNFNLDIASPFSPLTAFMMALSNYDQKLQSYEWNYKVFSNLVSPFELSQIRQQSQDNLKSIIIMTSMLSGFCFLYNSYLLFGWDYKITIVYCCISSFTVMIHKLLKSRTLSQYCCFNIFENLFFLSYLLSIVYFIEVDKVNINFVSYAQLVLQFIILAVTVLVNRGTQENDSQEQTFQIQEILIAAFKSICALQLVFISLRITEQITWGWIQTLIILWFILGLSFVISVCLFIDLIHKIKGKEETIEQDKRKIIILGGVWLNLIAFYFTLIPFFTLFGQAIRCDYNTTELNKYALGLTMLCYLLITTYYFKFKQNLIEYFLYYDLAQNGTHIPNLQQQGSTSNLPITENQIQLRKKRSRKISISRVPQFMVKLSQTYYKCAQMDDKSSISKTIRQQKQSLKNINYMDNDNDQSKRFDLLLSSPRQRLEISQSIAQDQFNKNNDKEVSDSQSTKQKKENQKSIKQCLVCYEKESNMINMPCGHGGFCKACCEQLLRKSDLCFLCRKPVTHSLQIQEVVNRESLVEVIEVVEAENHQQLDQN